MRDFIKTVGVGLLIIMGTGFAAMLHLGMWHSITPGVPALGFVDCVTGVSLVIGLGLIVASVTRD